MNRKIILTFIAMGIGIFVIAADITSINVALPAVEKDFKINLDTVEWIINGYLLAFAVLMVTCGRLADMYGRRKIFLIGLVLFAAASLIGGLAQDAGLLIAMRVLQGAAAAFMWPAILGICYASVSESRKGYAMGLVFAVGGFGNAAGPLFGGVLTEFLSWRWVLFVNVILAVLAGLITYFAVEEQSAEGEEEGIDYIGISTFSVMILALLYALDQSTSWGWLSLNTVGLFIISMIFLAIFLKIERKRDCALIPEDVMKNSTFMTYCIIMATIVPTFFALFLYVPQYLEKFKNYTPIEAGAGLVPMLLTYSLISPFSGRIYNSLGSRITIIAGMLLTSLGTFCLVFFGLGTSIIYMFLASMLCGAGIGLAIPSITTAGVGSVDESRASLAGGIIFMFQLSGAALGLAVITTLFIDTAINDLIGRISSLDLSLNAANIENIKSFILGSSTEQMLEANVGSSLLSKLLPHIKHSYTEGLRIGLSFSATVILIGAAVTLFFTKGHRGKS